MCRSRLSFCVLLGLQLLLVLCCFDQLCVEANSGVPKILSHGKSGHYPTESYRVVEPHGNGYVERHLEEYHHAPGGYVEIPHGHGDLHHGSRLEKRIYTEKHMPRNPVSVVPVGYDPQHGYSRRYPEHHDYREHHYVEQPHYLDQHHHYVDQHHYVDHPHYVEESHYVKEPHYDHNIHRGHQIHHDGHQVHHGHYGHHGHQVHHGHHGRHGQHDHHGYHKHYEHGLPVEIRDEHVIETHYPGAAKHHHGSSALKAALVVAGGEALKKVVKSHHPGKNTHSSSGHGYKSSLKDELKKGGKHLVLDTLLAGKSKRVVDSIMNRGRGSHSGHHEHYAHRQHPEMYMEREVVERHHRHPSEHSVHEVHHHHSDHHLHRPLYHGRTLASGPYSTLKELTGISDTEEASKLSKLPVAGRLFYNQDQKRLKREQKSLRNEAAHLMRQAPKVKINGQTVAIQDPNSVVKIQDTAQNLKMYDTLIKAIPSGSSSRGLIR